ncbi:MAG: hypothetical protein ACYDHH_22520 [Solirubrobacteraceae bacterium]
MWSTSDTVARRFAGVRRRRAVRLSAADFARAHPFLRVSGARDRGPALVVSFTDWPYQLKLEGMLLKALDLAGYEPVVLTTRAVVHAARGVFGAFGIERLLLLDDFIPPPSDGLPSELADALAHPSVQALKELHLRDANVGRHALSSVSRAFHEGSVDLADTATRDLVQHLLAESVRVLVASERVLDALAPELVVFNEARYAGCGPLFDVGPARGGNVVQFVSAFSDDAFVFKRYTRETRRIHPRSLSEENWAEMRDESWSDERQAELDAEFRRRYSGADLLSRRLHSRTRPRARDALIRDLALDPAKQTAVVFSHVLWDGNLFYGDDLFEDQGTWLVETAREAVANPAVNWVIRLHPANVWKLGAGASAPAEVEAINAAVGPLPQHVRLLLPTSDIAAESLFELASWGLTIRGTIGVELPCFGVPVLTAGTGHYTGRGFTVDSSSQDEYRRRLRQIQKIPPLDAEQTLLARKHAHALFCRRPLHFTSFRTTVAPGETDAAALELEPLVASEAGLRTAHDLRAFAEWAAAPPSEDYLTTSRAPAALN